MRVIVIFFQHSSSFHLAMCFIFVSDLLNCAYMNSRAQVPLFFSTSTSFSFIKHSICFQGQLLIIWVDAFRELSYSHSNMPLCWRNLICSPILSITDPCFSSPTHNWLSTVQSLNFSLSLIIFSKFALFVMSMHFWIEIFFVGVTVLYIFHLILIDWYFIWVGYFTFLGC